MRKPNLVITACLSIFVAQFFALTVELLDQYATAPAPTLAAAQETTHVTVSSASQDEPLETSPRLLPATYIAPTPTSDLQRLPTSRSVDFNDRSTPGS